MADIINANFLVGLKAPTWSNVRKTGATAAIVLRLLQTAGLVDARSNA